MTPDTENGFAKLHAACVAARERLGDPGLPLPDCPRLTQLVQGFGLSAFETQVLLLAAGVELDEGLAPALKALDPEGLPTLSFALPMARFAEAHWSALSPQGPLRYWDLVTLAKTRPLARAAISIDERILHHLTGLDPLDARLAPYLHPVAQPGRLPSGLQAKAVDLARQIGGDPVPVIEIEADDARDVRALSAQVSALAGSGLLRLNADDLPVNRVERDSFTRLWAREVRLTGRALLIENPGPACDGFARETAPIFTHGSAVALAGARPRLKVALPHLAAGDQAQVWHSGLGAAGRHVNGGLDRVIGHFTLGFSDTEEAAATARRAIEADRDPPDQALWDAARAVARPRLRDLAVEMPALADWSDMILPERETATLRAIAAQVRQRQKVYGDWGFAREGARGRGVSVLFSGPSGTGKTMSAEVLARELQLDLFRIDLSRVVSKFIGETEKNLATVFDAAEDGGAILLFDEADALFGKRSEVRDSHDRYANMEVSYLLQRMEAYRGLAILTTNFRAALDKAFARRLRFIVEFPFPGYDERLRIWQRAIPERADTQDLDFTRLAQLGVTGGAIRNIALNAAFLAAQDGTPICMAHLGRAAEAECAKIEKKIASAETRGWS